MQKTTLVIMAAGVGSRFGTGIKQLAQVGPNGEIIVDYSIHDALEAGFNKVVFIIRRDLEKEFREKIGKRIEKLCEVAYVFQEIADIPNGYQVPVKRKKPWGTGQAVLACRNLIKEPFAVINADDYYGKKAFVEVHKFLLEHTQSQYQYCMAGFILKNTLSENGGVTRGICEVDENNCLRHVVETRNIVKKNGVACVGETPIDMESYVSMNMWGLTPEFMEVLKKGFHEFLKELDSENNDAEYLLPMIIGNMLNEGQAEVSVLETNDKWFGVTYAEDKQNVIEAFQKLIENGVYVSPLNS